jgi:chemotaxis protein CheY-P-specific phosphatase CheC
MNEISIESEKRVQFFRDAGPHIADGISKAFSKLIVGEIAVHFIGVEIYKEISAVIDVHEKCFGSHVSVSNIEKDLNGIAFLFFPFSAISYLIEITLKQHFDASDDIPPTLKLSTFKEINNILLMRFVTELANSLGIYLETSVPVFTSFKNMKFMKQLDFYHKEITPLITVVQLDISSKTHGASSKKVRGRFVVIF